MKVAVTWWSASDPPGGASQAIRGNTKGFLDAGHDVDLYYHSESEKLEENASHYDLVLSPYMWIDQYPDMKAFDDTHLHFQMGGYGNTQRDPEGLRQVIYLADSASVLDPGPALWYEEQIQEELPEDRDEQILPLEEMAVIPNAPNFDLFPRQPVDESDGFVLSPKIGAFHKTGAFLVMVAGQTPTYTYESHLKRTEDFLAATNGQLPGNVHLKPPVPFTSMPRRYREASVVFNAAERETMPNVAFESFMSGRPYVAHKDAIALLQSAAHVDVEDFGNSIEWFMEHYEDRWYTADHAHLVDDVETIPEIIQDLMVDRDAREQLGEDARTYMESQWSDWTWEAKAEAIIDQMD